MAGTRGCPGPRYWGGQGRSGEMDPAAPRRPGEQAGVLQPQSGRANDPQAAPPQTVFT